MSEKTDKTEKWKPNTDQLAVLEALRAEVAAAESAAEFARHHLPFGSSKLSKILNVFDPEAPTSYFDEVTDPEPTIREIEEALGGIKTDRALRVRLSTEEIFKLKKFEAIRAAVRECRQKRTPERLVKYIAPTGGGKTMLCNYLAGNLSARIAEGREMWRHPDRGYGIFLQDICRAARIRIQGATRVEEMEAALVNASGERAITLAIDEGEFFGSRALNGIRYLLNKTSIVIVICAIRQAHDRWNKWFTIEADQLARRTHAIVEMDAVSEHDASMFFGLDQFKHPEDAIEMIAGSASTFGMFSAVKRIAAHLANTKHAAKTDVEKAIQRAGVEMGRSLSFAREEARR